MSSGTVRRAVLKHLATGVAVASIPVGVWWYWARKERFAVSEQNRTKIRVPNLQDTDDYLIEKCQPGDVIVFDRRCERCAAGPWAALSCLAGKQFLCNEKSMKAVEFGKFDHVGIVVPGYVNSRHDDFDDSNLLLLEATPSGIVAQPLKKRLEETASRSVILLQLCGPGEKRNVSPADIKANNAKHQAVVKAREHVERELRQFRDQWIALGEQKGYKWIHSTMALGGALAVGLGLQDYLSGPVSPSAYFVLMGLQKAAAAQNINESDNRKVKVEDYLRDYRFMEHDAVRLRPGWRFLAPIPLRETGKI